MKTSALRDRLSASPLLAKVKQKAKRAAKIVAYLLFCFAFVSGSLEIFLRVFVSYNPGYYVGFRDAAGKTIHFPYGDIHFNSIGAPDDEFDEVKTKPRIAYVGDSICFGVGAGYGYRITERLDALLPQYDHMNMSGGPGSNGVGEGLIQRMNQRIDRYKIDAVVYILNLNDILPEQGEAAADDQVAAASLRGKLEWLRRDSYLFNYIRTAVKTFYMRKGYNHTGTVAFELFPDKYPEIFATTAKRINHFGEAMKAKGVKFIVVVSPYEMQISSEAEQKYAAAGIKWGPTFIDRGPQRVLIPLIDSQFPLLDAYDAFVDPKGQNADRTREANKLGALFVYNLGDRLDWNHPNRDGHKLMAEQIAASGILQKALEGSKAP